MRTQVRTRASGADLRIAELATAQHGVVARRQLLAVGLSSGAIGLRLRAGRLHRIHAGVYAVGHSVLSREARWMAAALFCGPHAALSHRSAAALWGIRAPASGPVEVTVRAKSVSRGSIRRHFALLPADELTIHHGIPTTTVPRTIFDLAAVLGLGAVEHALRESERLRLFDVLSLPALVDRYPRHRGNRVIRECLVRLRDMPSGVSREELEARFLAFLDARGLPRPHLNVWLTIGSKRYQVDCLWPVQRMIVELDGYAAHGTRRAFESDRVRDRKLAVAGYRSVRVTWWQLHDEPATVADDLRLLLSAAEAG
jgi:very-short-patch-repair endonuclease